LSASEITLLSLIYCFRCGDDVFSVLWKFVWALVEDAEVVVKSRTSALYAHPRGHLFSQLSDLLYFCEGYEINDQTGTQLSDDEVLLAPSSHVQALQCLVFKQVPKVG
jgi:intron-binding protein aquarius